MAKVDFFLKTQYKNLYKFQIKFKLNLNKLQKIA